MTYKLNKNPAREKNRALHDKAESADIAVCWNRLERSEPHTSTPCLNDACKNEANDYYAIVN